MSNLFWLTDAQMARLEPFFPKSHGKPRVDDRRVLSGIIFINRNGLRWCDAPKEYGPPKTLYNRWKRWGDKGVFARMMEGLASEASIPGKPVNKWELLRELSKAQVAFGVSERDLTVLQGLLSFFPDDALGGNAEMVVFPSNKAICERLNGMPCSTMRRHLARLVEAGLLVRRDSPNGKRYVRKHGGERVAFGFDLSPLYCRTEEIARAAEAVREAEGRVRRLRECAAARTAEMRKSHRSAIGFGQ